MPLIVSTLLEVVTASLRSTLMPSLLVGVEVKEGGEMQITVHTKEQVRNGVASKDLQPKISPACHKQ